MTDLRGKTIFITGASRGIGREIALRCARDGANVAITGRSENGDQGTIHSVAEEVEAAGGHALALRLDVRDGDVLRAVAEEAAQYFGGIDVLINNAGAINLTGTLDTPAKRLDLMWEVNARATFLASQACIPYLKKAANPHILNLSPPLNLNPGWVAPHVAYTLSKYGMSLCALGMAREFAADGIAVNCLWPRTTIATAAIEVNFPAEVMRASRTPAIVADAAYHILTRDSRACTGNFFVDEEVLREAGVTDLAGYAVTPGSTLRNDLFLD